MKPTADQVIEGFDALPPEEKRRAYETITQHRNKPSSDEGDYYFKRTDDSLQHTLADSQKIRWKGILIAFVPNVYVSNYTEIWRLESVLGSSIVRATLRENHILDADFIELLFRQSPYSFYLNQAETWLFSDYGDLSEAEGGPLKPVTAFDALQRYGLTLLEAAKEEQYVRL